MIQKAYARYCAIEKALDACSPRFQAVLSALSEDSREVVLKYLGIRAEMEERITELACFVP